MEDTKTSKLKQEVDSLREKVQQEAEQLEEKFSPENAIDKLWAEARSRFGSPESKEFLNRLYSDVKRNPLALVLVGSGIALLFKKESFERPQTLAERVRQKQEGISRVSGRALESGREWVDRSKDFISENPAAVVGLGIVLGSIAAAFGSHKQSA